VVVTLTASHHQRRHDDDLGFVAGGVGGLTSRLHHSSAESRVLPEPSSANGGRGWHGLCRGGKNWGPGRDGRRFGGGSIRNGSLGLRRGGGGGNIGVVVSSSEKHFSSSCIINNNINATAASASNDSGTDQDEMDQKPITTFGQNQTLV